MAKSGGGAGGGRGRGAAGGDVSPLPPARAFDSMGDAADWGDEHYTSWANNLSSDEQAELVDYARSGYSDTNRRLRAGESPDTTVRLIDSALSTARVPDPVEVYRGVRDQLATDLRAMHDQGQLIGSTITDKGYMSTSLNRDEARGRAGDGVLMEIRVPRGAKAGYLNAAGAPQTSELEMLVARGSRIKVVSAGVAGARFVIRAELLS